MRKMLFSVDVGRWGGIILAGSLFHNGLAQTNYRIFVSDEKSGDISVLNGGNFQFIKTIPVGQRPLGMQASPDGKTLYVALGGTPAEPSPPSDANGVESKTAADGIGVVDLASDTFLHKIPAGPDPAQFALSLDGERLYAANEDAGTATVTDIATEKIIASIPVNAEPAGVGASPDGKFFYVGCGTGEDIFAIDTARFKVIGRIKVNSRPRSVAFLPDGSKAYVSSEAPGEINVLDTRTQTLLKTIALPEGCVPMCIQLAVDGKRIYASTGSGGTICVIDTALEQVVDNIKVDQGPCGIALSPDGKFLFAANGPSDDISIIDLAVGKEVVRVKLAAGSSPWGIVTVPTVK
jgi:YVTN family beta-propeller protein